MKKRLYANAGLICCIILLIILISVNIYDYINYTYNTGFYSIRGVNAFSFWYYVRNLNVGQIMIFISPLIIIICGIYSFYNKLSSGFFQNELLKQSYNKFILKEFSMAYLKGTFILPILSIIILLVGVVLFGDHITVLDSALQILYLPVGIVNSPYLYVFLSIILLFMYGILTTNTALIIIHYSKKFYMITLISFIIINSFNFLVSNIGVLISKIMSNETLYRIAININIYDGYSPEIKIGYAFLTIGIYLLISFIILIIMYNKKERIIEMYD